MKQEIYVVDEFANGSTDWAEIKELDVLPVKDPIGIEPVKDSQELAQEIFIKMAVVTYTGGVIDGDSGDPIPGASVSLMAGGSLVNQTQTNGNGYFEAGAAGGADTIAISHVGYKTLREAADPNKHIFYLEKDVKDLDPVILDPGGATGGKKIWPWLVLAAVAVYAMK